MSRRMESIRCLFPSSLEEAVSMLGGNEGCRPMAGGTDLVVQWASGLAAPPGRVVMIRHIPELRRLERSGEVLLVGAAVTHSELASSELVRSGSPALATAAASVGARQIQNMGTIGGNIANASPAGDLAPALLAAGASVVLAGASGERKLALDDFFVSYKTLDMAGDELIVRFEIPVTGRNERETFLKLGPRKAQAISKVMAAARFCLDEGRVAWCRIGMGSVAPIPIRLKRVEAWLAGRTPDDETLDELAERVRASVSPIDDIRSTAAYRRWVAGSLVRSCLRNAAASPGV